MIAFMSADRALAVHEDWAQENRAFFRSRTVRAYHVIGSPGAGKTALLEKTLEAMQGRLLAGVIRADSSVNGCAGTILKKGIPIYQIPNGTGSPVDARSINLACQHFCREREFDLIFISHTVDLACAGEMDIGAHAKVAVLSVTEGHESIARYPLLFSQAKILVITKMTLLSQTQFDLDRAAQLFHSLNPDAPVIYTDSLSGLGVSDWIRLLTGSSSV